MTRTTWWAPRAHGFHASSSDRPQERTVGRHDSRGCATAESLDWYDIRDDIHGYTIGEYMASANLKDDQVLGHSPSSEDRPPSIRSLHCTDDPIPLEQLPSHELDPTGDPAL